METAAALVTCRLFILHGSLVLYRTRDREVTDLTHPPALPSTALGKPFIHIQLSLSSSRSGQMSRKPCSYIDYRGGDH